MRIWVVCWIGYHNRLRCESVFYTDYHADQYARALRMNGVPDVRIDCRTVAD